MRPLPATSRPAPVASPVTGTATRLPALDALRGIAIVLVLGYHFAPAGLVTSPAARAVLAVLQAGWVGVDLFFVLSGFLITGILLDGRGEPGTLWRFYGRRALRILPLYYGTLAVLLAVALALRGAGTATDASTDFVRDQAWYWLHGANLAAARDAQWATQSWVQHFWSLAVEEQFYLLWPAVVLLLPRRLLPRAVVVLLVTAFVTRVVLAVVAEQAIAAYVLTPARADALGLGALLAIAWRTPAWHAPATRAAAALAPLMGAALAAIVVTQGPGSHGLLMATIGHSYWALLFAALLWLAVAPRGAHASPTAWTTRWQAWLERRRWLHVMARYSYGLYVVHIPLRQWLATRGMAGVDFIPAHGEWVGGAIGIAVGVLASLAVAVPLWHLYERPILARGGAWLDRRLAGHADPTARGRSPAPRASARAWRRQAAR